MSTEKILATITEAEEDVTATFKEGLIIIGTSTMDIDIITTDPIPADTDTDIEHNKGTTDIFFTVACQPASDFCPNYPLMNQTTNLKFVSIRYQETHQKPS